MWQMWRCELQPLHTRELASLLVGLESLPDGNMRSGEIFDQ
jgi:hypothetical protein